MGVPVYINPDHILASRVLQIEPESFLSVEPRSRFSPGLPRRVWTNRVNKLPRTSSVSSRVLFLLLLLLLRLLLPVLLHLACVCDARDEHFFIFRDGLADERALYRNLVVARLRPSLQKIPRYTPITITSHVGDACRPFLRRLRSAERTPPASSESVSILSSDR